MKKSRIYVVIVLVFTVAVLLTMTSSFAENIIKQDAKTDFSAVKTLEDFKSVDASLREKFKTEVEQISIPTSEQGIKDRQDKSTKFKEDTWALGQQYNTLNLPIEKKSDESELLNLIDLSKGGEQSKIISYDNDKSYLTSPENMKDYEKIKKRLEFLNILEKDFKEGKLTAKEALSKFPQIKDIQ